MLPQYRNKLHLHYCPLLQTSAIGLVFDCWVVIGSTVFCLIHKGSTFSKLKAFFFFFLWDFIIVYSKTVIIVNFLLFKPPHPKKKHIHKNDTCCKTNSEEIIIYENTSLRKYKSTYCRSVIPVKAIVGKTLVIIYEFHHIPVIHDYHDTTTP